MKKKLSVVIFTLALALCVSVFAFGCGKGGEKPAQTDCVITFDYNYAGAPAAVVKTVKSGEKVEKPADPSQAGYTFGGWYADGALYDFDSAVSSDMTLLAMWNERGSSVNPDECKITFKETDGVEFIFERNQPVTALKEDVIEFSVNTSPFYAGAPVVKVNDAEITADGYGVYSFTVEKNTTVEVTGLEKDTSVMQGMGTQDKPYQIATPTQYMEFATKANSANSRFAEKNYVLTADLDFKGYTIPTVEIYTEGTFDGRGHTIKNYVIDYSENIGNSEEIEDSTNIGLFGRLVLATVKNLNLENFKISNTSNSACYVGGLAGDAVSSVISGVNASGEIVGSASGSFFWCVGGIAGNARTISSSAYTGITTDIIFCNADVNISCGQLGNFGGLVGRTASSSMSEPVLIANCSASGDVKGGHSAGGLVGYMTTFTSVTNCYATGNVAAQCTDYVVDVNAGGIAGSIDAYETVIANCFSTSSLSATASSSSVGYRGYLYGSKDYDIMQLEHYIPSYIKGYYYLSGRIYCGNDSRSESVVGDIRNKDTLLNMLGWKSERWDFGENNYGYPKALSSVAQAYSVTVNFPGEEIEIVRNNKTELHKNTFYDSSAAHDIELFTPLYLLFGTDGIYKKVGDNRTGFLSTTKNVSVGYFADEECTVALPSSYLLADDMQDIYIGFSTPLNKQYVYEMEGFRYDFSFNDDGLAGTEGAMYNYIYYGNCKPFEQIELTNGNSYDIKYYFENTPGTLLGDSAWGFEMNGRIYLTDFNNIYTCLYPYTPVSGVWTNTADGKTYEFNVDGTGTVSDGGKFVHGYNGETQKVSISVNGESAVEYDYTENALNSAGNPVFTKGHEYHGKYEFDMYNRNGMPAVEFDLNGNLVGNGLAGATIGKDADNRLTLAYNNNTYVLSRENGFAGVWSTVSGRVLTLNGIGVYGTGEAVDSGYGNLIYAYDRESDILQFYRASDRNYIGFAQIIRDNENFAQTQLVAAFAGNVFVFKLTDKFQGTWYSDNGGKFEFDYRNVYVNGDKNAVQYNYISQDMVAFDCGEDSYLAMFTDGLVIVAKNLDTENREVFSQYDSYYGVGLMTADRSLALEFNGLGAFGEGKVAVTTPNEDYELYYTVNEDGQAIVSDGDIVLYTIGYNETDKYYYILNEDGDDTVLGIANPFTGSWVEQYTGSVISVGVFNADLEASGYVSTNMVKWVYNPVNSYAEMYFNGRLQDNYLFVGEHGLMYREVSGNSFMDFTVTVPDELAGIWEGAQDGATDALLVDGVGLSSDYYVGFMHYFPSGNSNTAYTYFSTLYNGERVVAVRMFIGSGYMNYAVLRFTDAAGYNDMYNSLYNRGVLLNVFKYSDDESGEPTRFMFWEALDTNGLNKYESISDSNGNTFRFLSDMTKEAVWMIQAGIGGYKEVYVQFAGQREEQYFYQIDYVSDNGKTVIAAVYDMTASVENGLELKLIAVVTVSIDDDGNAEVTNIAQ